MRTCKFDASLRCFLVPSVFRARVSAYSVVGSGCLPELPNDMQTYRVSRMSTRRLILPFVPGHPLHPALISAPSSVLSLFPPLPSCGHAERQHQMRGIQRVWGYTCKVHLPPVLLLPSRNSRGGQRAEGEGLSPVVASPAAHHKGDRLANSPACHSQRDLYLMNTRVGLETDTLLV